MDVVEEVRPEQVWDRERERVKKKEKEKELPSESLVFKQLRKFTPLWEEQMALLKHNSLLDQFTVEQNLISFW